MTYLISNGCAKTGKVVKEAENSGFWQVRGDREGLKMANLCQVWPMSIGD